MAAPVSIKAKPPACSASLAPPCGGGSNNSICSPENNPAPEPSRVALFLFVTVVALVKNHFKTSSCVFTVAYLDSIVSPISLLFC
ncbi:MAG TPA: hypothetical protein DEQ20_09995 [Desulfobulbaceae bacterium]|nr:hypothetical protein [Desulfobulbaceae bacterium]